ncbi:DedA family protein [Actinomyces respiraculi]|uniref:DedA family protein n=1 Tax=Actinomyces respiraculi TaxID=2744574 RepID=UPI0039A65DD6
MPALLSLSHVAATTLPALGPDWLDPASMITTFVQWVGPWAVLGVMLVIFAETGLLVGFFLPGDSLLFTLGLFVHTGQVPVNIWVVSSLMWVAAVAGDQTGYAIGRKAGPAIFNKPDSRLFKQEHVTRTRTFFNRHGGKAVTLACFVPIVRTFTPVMAGVGQMRYRHFVGFNVLGATVWAFALVWLGYVLGGHVWIRENIDATILTIVGLSLLPMVISWLSARLRRRSEITEGTEGTERA